MGMMYSCPGADCAFDRSLDALYNRSISFHGDNAPGAAHSTSFKGCSDASILKALGSGKMMIEGSLSFKRRDLDPYNIETKFSIRASDMDMEDVKETSDFESPKTEYAEQSVQLALVSETSSPKHKAAVKLQKVYKSFRTRRKLADCAVLVEQRWWKLLDYALLNGSSVSYFDIKKAESVISRWARARTKAAKVGKGLSKDGKARKLAVEHWLEAIDPRHRYGHNLRFYYVHWLRCESRQPFFYWLDIGEGKEVNLEQHCPRWKLQQQCIKYLGPKEREAYEVEVEDGKLLYKQTRQLLDTPEDKLDTKWIFVLSASRNLYVGQKKKGTFQHSSFLAGGATSAAGRLVVTNGVLKAVWPHSGHYRPTEENFQELETFLMENNVDLSNVKRSPSDVVELQAWKKGSVRSSSSNSDLVGAAMMENGSSMLDDEAQENTSSGMGSRADGPLSGYAHGLSNNSIDLKFLAGNQNLGSETVKDHPAFDQIYTQYSHDLFREFEGDSEEESDSKTDEMEQTGTNDKPQTDGEVGSYNKPQTDGDQTGELATSEQRYIYQKHNLFVEEPSDNEEDTVPNEKIIQRINSKKGMKSFQLGKQLSFKWTTGAGPRIGWVRDYPSELQFHALEQVNLSPRGARTPRAVASPRITTLSPRPPNLS